jgi:hypothetical protein
MTVFQLILRRFTLKLGYRLWGFVSVSLFFLLLVIIMYFLRDYECPVRRALGLPTSFQESEGAFAHLSLEHHCEPSAKQPKLNPTPH